ncbi:hypothetical protein H4J02_08415 [Protaetiibacter sp. SSC-01]|uniref:hypothetical protein n=1 Tax=Protaetiibacter sp. SSC-01 TaxID=2759943 RepID=UPI001656A3A7|nr:hypothetical protein [Protaetiibacter sp. SSC-01]QNO36542.1 hypothetical protein H4J02_08415 [Protaetiibacter sp. SSC-01]
MMKNRRPAAFALAAVIPAAVLLSGCSIVDEVLYQERSVEFASAADLTTEWAGSAPWVPDDAADIRIREKTDGEVVTILLTSDSKLDESLCAEVERRSAPAFAVEGAPDVFKADDVWACGDWAVVPSDGGWFAWTPNHPDELAASPS